MTRHNLEYSRFVLFVKGRYLFSCKSCFDSVQRIWVRKLTLCIHIVESHGDSQWLSEFCRDASQESTTLEAGYTFIKTQTYSCFTICTEKETTISTRVWLRQCLQIPEPHTISCKNLLTPSERINGLRTPTWSSIKPTIAQRESPLSPGKKR